MFYTVGKTKNYNKYFALQGNPSKLGKCFLNGKPYEGGSIWRTYKEANEYLKKNECEDYSVYGVLAKEEDIEFKNGFIGSLLKTSIIVKISRGLKNAS